MMLRMSLSFVTNRTICIVSPFSLNFPSVRNKASNASCVHLTTYFHAAGFRSSTRLKISGISVSGRRGVRGLCNARGTDFADGQSLKEMILVEECSQRRNEKGEERKSSLGDGDVTEVEDQAASTSTTKAKGKLEGGLYLVATPIGNLEDMTFRAVRVLKAAEVILAEDTRHSARLLQHYDITTPMMSYHKFNEFARRDATVQRLKLGGILALISDAGMPGISDPGSELVRACVAACVRVHPVPGASAVVTALVASGLSTDEFSFVGFLPTHATTRKRKLASAAKQTATQIFYVPPHKLSRILEDLCMAFGSTRRCVVAREMTKLHEEFWRGTLEQAQKEFEERIPRGEMTLVIEGLSESAAEQLPTDEDIGSQLQTLMTAGISPSEASRQVVEGTGVRRKVVYALALKLSKGKVRSTHSSVSNIRVCLAQTTSAFGN